MPDTQPTAAVRLWTDSDDRVLLDAGLRRIEQFQGLISHADTKAGLIASAAGLLLGATAANTDALQATFAATTGPHRVAQALLVVTAVALSGAGVTAGVVLAPRIRQPRARNVFAFPDETPVEPCFGVGELAEQAWAHGTLLAHVAAAKYTAVRRALGWAGLAVLAFTAWTVCAVTL